MSDQPAQPRGRDNGGEGQTVALRIIAALLLTGAAWLLSSLLVPLLLAVVVAIAVSPIAGRLERVGMPRALAGLCCTLVIAAALIGAAGLILYQAGSMLKDSDRYTKRFGQLLATASRRMGGNQLLESLNLIGEEDRGESGSRAPGRGPAPKPPGGAAREDRQDAAGQGQGPDDDDSGGIWAQIVRRNAEALGRWVITGLGGLLGVVGGGVLFLAFMFYILQTRSEWLERITRAMGRLGMTPDEGVLEGVRHEIVTFIGCLSIVASGYAIVTTLTLWAIGVPQPLLWGLLAGMLEVVPYFGPLVASILPTIVALSLGSWWKPLAVAGQFLALHLVEGYLVSPLLYGRAVRFDPVTILFGSLFFGWLWGPLGLALSMPMMILLRGLLLLSPGTPALDALAGVEETKDLVESEAPARS